MLRVLDARHFRPGCTSALADRHIFLEAKPQHRGWNSPSSSLLTWQGLSERGEADAAALVGNQPWWVSLVNSQFIESTRDSGIERIELSHRSFDWGQVISSMSLLTCHAPAQRASVQNTEAKHVGLFVRRTFSLPTCQQDKSSRLFQQQCW